MGEICFSLFGSLKKSNNYELGMAFKEKSVLRQDKEQIYMDFVTAQKWDWVPFPDLCLSYRRLIKPELVIGGLTGVDPEDVAKYLAVMVCNPSENPPSDCLN